MSYELYKVFQEKIGLCDQKIEKFLTTRLQQTIGREGMKLHEQTLKVQKKKNKNAPKIDLQNMSIQLANGLNLYQIEGVGDATVLSIMSETGFDLSKFPTAKHFSSWLALSPNNKITGGKVIKSHTAHHNNRLAQALRSAANSIGNQKEGKLNQFFKRIAYRYGRAAAITATARKLAVIIWNMLTKNEPYKYEEADAYKEKLRNIQLRNIQRKIQTLKIKNEELNFVNT